MTNHADMLAQVGKFLRDGEPKLLTLQFSSAYEAHLAISRLNNSSFKFLAARRGSEIFVCHSKAERDAAFPLRKWDTRPYSGRKKPDEAAEN